MVDLIMSFDNIISSLVLQLGTVHLCRSVIRSIETARIFDFEEFPIRDKVRLLIFYIFLKKKIDALGMKRLYDI